jgi:hypothetical protein
VSFGNEKNENQNSSRDINMCVAVWPGIQFICKKIFPE